VEKDPSNEATGRDIFPLQQKRGKRNMIQFSKERLTRSSGKALATGFALAAIMLTSLMASGPAQAATTFTVNNTGDPGSDGICNAASCTLREAINAANSKPGADTIEFSIPRANVQSIRPSSQLPTITETVTIDGYSQFGSSPNTLEKGTDARLLIELDGVNAGSLASGLEISADEVVVRGLVIQRFGGDGIATSGEANRIEGNFIGTDPFGRKAGPGNDDNGVNLLGSNNVVGGDKPESRNLISGNEGAGVNIFGTRVFGAADGNKVEGNLIGTDKTGVLDLGNSFAGVFMIDASRNVVGGGASEANTIAFNGQDGVGIAAFDAAVTDAPRNNPIRSNSIHSNGDLGVDLGADGPTANDAKDPDEGENALQNRPGLTSAVTSGGKTTVRGKLNSTPNRRFLIDLYSNPSGNEGKRFLGQKLVTTNANGVATFNFTPAQAVAVGQTVTATATDQGRNTSEFSGPRAVVAQ
jgi:CSLREA domain-containing protein